MSNDGTERLGIPFADEYVDQIMDGEKTVTIRYDFEHEFDQGDIVELVNQNGHKLTTAKIVTQCELRADWVTFADFAGHRRYTTTGELLEKLSEYYPDANLHPKVVLDVIVFETDLIVTDGGQPADGTEHSIDDGDIFRVERWSDAPSGEEVACADCGVYRDLIGPVSHDGEVMESGDMVCPDCAEARGLDLSHCTCGTSSPSDMPCPGCGDYLGYECRSVDPGVGRNE